MIGLRRRLADDSGFTMFAVTVTMMVLGVFAVGAWATANNDMPLARASQDHKRAYEAAQAGLEWYAFQLQRDPTYWAQCASVPPIATGIPAPVNLQWDGAKPDPRVWRTQGDGSRYTLEILRRDNSSTQCTKTSADTTALQDNTLRIRSTGQANGETRTVIGTFKRKSFMDFIYFTSSEAQDPTVGGGSVDSCLKVRSTPRTGCTEISFSGNDFVNGPLHTNDSSVQICGNPTFGRTGRNDVFEVSGPSPGYVVAGGNNCPGSSTPNFKGTKTFKASSLNAPPQNSGLADLAGPSFTFRGQTCLKFHGTQVDVYTSQAWKGTGGISCTGTYTTKDLTGASGPPNGVIYIGGDTTKSCTAVEGVAQPYTSSSGCGDVAVEGDYGASVTVGAENDIIITKNLTQTANSNSMLGLIATNFVRVYHPVGASSATNCGSNDEPDGFTAVTTIEAAILALNHSFMVDNYGCTKLLGTLKVTGAIAQKFRGTVATGGGGTTSTGYKKDYWYDDRLKVREPPNFLDPVKTSWRVVRETEQVPATK